MYIIFFIYGRGKICDAVLFKNTCSSDLQACDFIKKEAPTQELSCEYSENFKGSFFYETLPVDASGGGFD